MNPTPPESETTTEPRRHRSRWWIALAVVGALIVGAVAVVAFLFLVREDPGEKSLSDAVEDFRSSNNDDGGPRASQPPPGVYELEGEGRAELSLPPLHQDDGATMPMTVTSVDDDCWTLRIDFNEAHWQELDLCTTDEGLVESGGRGYQRWDLGATSISNTTTFDCDPPALFALVDVEPGTSVERSCSGVNDQVDGSTTSTGPLTFVGVDTVSVAGEDVEAWHFRHERELTGGQEGTELLDYWLAVENFLPLRGERTIEVRTDSPVGAITYTESGSWVLVSRQPHQ